MSLVDKYSGQVTAEEVFFRAMANIAGLSNSIYSNTDADWQKNALNYEKAVDALEALASPFLSDEYFDKMEKIIAEARIAYFVNKRRMTAFQLMKVGHDMEVKMTCDISNERIRQIQFCLHERGIVFGKTYQVIEEDDVGTVEISGDELGVVGRVISEDGPEDEGDIVDSEEVVGLED